MKLLYPRGLCQQIENYDMSKNLIYIWHEHSFGNVTPDITIYLTDPNRQTKFSIETISQHGSQIVGKPGFILYYEVGVLVEDLTDPAQIGACDADNSFAACIDDKLQTLFLKVNIFLHYSVCFIPRRGKINPYDKCFILN